MLVVTEFRESSVKEGTTTTFICSSDEGNPSPTIRWTHGIGTSKVKSGRFNASVTESTLDITVDRTMHEQEIVCFIDANQTKGQKRLENRVVLSVKCELFVIFSLGKS